MARHGLAGLALLTAAVTAACASTSHVPVTPGTSSCPKGTATPAAGEGGDLVARFIATPGGFERIPDRADTSLGYESFNDAVAAIPDERPALTADGFQYGYHRAWQRTHVRVALEIGLVKYRDAAGAAAITTHATAVDKAQAVARGDTVSPLAVTGIPAAAGYTDDSQSANTAIYVVQFARGAVHATVEVLSVITPATVDDSPAALGALVVSEAQAQYAALAC